VFGRVPAPARKLDEMESDKLVPALQPHRQSRR